MVTSWNIISLVVLVSPVDGVTVVSWCYTTNSFSTSFTWKWWSQYSVSLVINVLVANLLRCTVDINSVCLVRFSITSISPHWYNTIFSLTILINCINRRIFYSTRINLITNCPHITLRHISNGILFSNKWHWLTNEIIFICHWYLNSANYFTKLIYILNAHSTNGNCVRLQLTSIVRNNLGTWYLFAIKVLKRNYSTFIAHLCEDCSIIRIIRSHISWVPSTDAWII